MRAPSLPKDLSNAAKDIVDNNSNNQRSRITLLALIQAVWEIGWNTGKGHT